MCSTKLADGGAFWLPVQTARAPAGLATPRLVKVALRVPRLSSLRRQFRRRPREGGSQLASLTRTARGEHAVAGTELTVRLRNHSITAAQTHGHRVTLRLHDGRQVVGFLSEGGATLVRTGAIT